MSERAAPPLRIFLAAARSPNPAFTSDIWKANLHDPLVAMGHDVVLWDGGINPLFDLDPDAPGTAVVRGRFTRDFLDAVEAAHRERSLDLVFTYVSDSHLEPAAIDAVRDHTAPIVNFFCNNGHQFHLVRRNARHFTRCLVPEAAALPMYRAAGTEPIFFPMAANPALYRPVATASRYEATFAGQRYAERPGSILALREAGIDAHAFGSNWIEAGPAAGAAAGTKTPGAARASGPPGGPWNTLARAVSMTLQGRNPFLAARDRREWDRLRTRHTAALHGPTTDEGYVALFSEGRISLGFMMLGDTHRTRHPLRQVRLREFEGPMSGAFYLTGWIEELALHYDIGKEIVCYHSREEMVDLCRYYLAHESERERIRRAGHERARRDHTWQRRFEDLFATLGRDGVLRRADF